MDDGMLLNFDLGDAPLVARPSFKGGRWKDRLTAKKAVARRQKKSANPDSHSGGDAEAKETDDRPAKRQRVEELIQGRPQRKREQPVQAKPGDFVSSLFTSNPESRTKDEVQEPESSEPIAPTNAPLSPELENFTTLGLSPNIASHLLNKLDIKAPTAIQKAAVSQLLKEDSDAFIQAQTGSGKTLAYLLPIVQRLVSLGDKVQRGSGLFAIVLAPTRELSKQISVVLENLLRCAHWIVAGTVIGGEKKKSEKARVRKGLNILVATPGRLVDHLEHTEALDVSNVRWLVLDEGDRLMELGFENDIQKIVGALNLRMKSNKHRIPGLPEKRMTILCSATMKMNVQRLGEISLKEAVHIQADPAEKNENEEEKETAFSAPAQLKQSYAVVPAKLRLVTLMAVLKRAFARKGSVNKVIVFVSCADSVEFHFEVLARSEEEEEKDSKQAPTEKKAPKQAPTEKKDSKQAPSEKKDPKDKTDQKDAKEPAKEKDTKQPPTIRTSLPAPLLSSPSNPVTIFKLHGSMAQSVRTSTLTSFTRSSTPSVLICTDVASRGLDLPNVDFVIEYDPAFSADDHLHRIGRTARAGRDGRALLFLQPGPEEGYVSQVLRRDRPDAAAHLARHDADELLARGFAPTSGVVRGGRREWEDAATAAQLAVERWALANPARLEQARRAYQSHVRAYATHVAAERGFFDIKALHLGHLAKAFALRDKPGAIRVPGLRPGAEAGKEERRGAARKGGKAGVEGRNGKVGGSSAMDDVDASAKADMDEAGRKMRALARKMAMGGAGEFNLG
ncbi:ATP-dependent RNA helicase-like protein dbp7 [Phyllosticta capitalensis]|uniref:ATP-dependent RNA helicase n=1 Tax=Phyllosticta capitalensis TaxID=121624 RepID=A0ABR1YS65_9PEZI